MLTKAFEYVCFVVLELAHDLQVVVVVIEVAVVVAQCWFVQIPPQYKLKVPTQTHIELIHPPTIIIGYLLKLNKNVIVIVEVDLGGHGVSALVYFPHRLLTVVVRPVHIKHILMPVEVVNILLADRGPEVFHLQLLTYYPFYL